ncbi:MAG: ABC transporter permease [Lachnospiraceae bacterium]|nr:ABC transporter permease [Lachnospiraceae bacterium]
MNCLQMAWRSCVRKPVKSILLLLVVCMISVFLISGMTSQNASVATQDKTRQAIGAGFLLEENEVNRHTRIDIASKKIGEKEGTAEGVTQKKEVINGTDSWGVTTDNSFETLKMEDIEKIAALSGIADYNVTTAQFAVNPVNFNRIEDVDTDQNSDTQGVTLLGSRNMSMDSNVLTGNVSIEAGRMISEKDTNVCVISEELADKNQLSIGDKLSFNDYHDRDNSTVYEAEVIGIYNVKQKMTPYMSGDTYGSENVIFTDLRFPEKVIGDDGNPLFEKAYFKVANVNDYDSVKEAIKKLDIEWLRYDLIDNNGNLDTMSSNFNDLQNISQILVCVVVGASFVILLLIFIFWIKGRVQEIGILLSMGTTKWKILTQIWIEAIMVATIAMLISFAVAPVVSKITADYLVEQQVQQVADKEELDNGKVATDYQKTEQKVTGVNVGITWKIVLLDGVGVIVLISISVLGAGITILRRNPKDILIEMN